MKIKRSPVMFHNVLSMTDVCKSDEWQTIALVMRNFVAQNSLYTNAPVIYQYVEEERDDGLVEFSIYLPINRPIELAKDIPMSFLPELRFDDALTFRIADVENSIVEETYLLLELYATEQGFTLKKPFYHVHMSLFGDSMLDVIAPIIPAEEDIDVEDRKETEPGSEAETETENQSMETFHIPLDIQTILSKGSTSKWLN